MNRESINPDDPLMTAYALGELSVAEAAEFEARLHDSPIARAELSSMREIMGLLSDGLRTEWQGSIDHPTLRLLEHVEGAESKVIVAGKFRPTLLKYAAAAAVAGTMLVGGMIVSSQKEVSVASNLGGGIDKLKASVSETSFVESATVAAVHVPQLFLANEIDDVSRLDLVGEEGALDSQIDASYLDAGQIIPASFNPGTALPDRGVSPERGQSFDRVDSYLPPLSSQGVVTGMIEKRLSKGYLSGTKARHGNSVLVSGYVTMGGGLQYASADEGLTGFRPVSISGNPVVSDGIDLQLLSDLNGLQKDLSKVVTSLPEGTTARVELEGILNKSSRIVSELKQGLSH